MWDVSDVCGSNPRWHPDSHHHVHHHRDEPILYRPHQRRACHLCRRSTIMCLRLQSPPSQQPANFAKLNLFPRSLPSPGSSPSHQHPRRPRPRCHPPVAAAQPLAQPPDNRPPVRHPTSLPSSSCEMESPRGQLLAKLAVRHSKSQTCFAVRLPSPVQVAVLPPAPTPSCLLIVSCRLESCAQPPSHCASRRSHTRLPGLVQLTVHACTHRARCGRQQPNSGQSICRSTSALLGGHGPPPPPVWYTTALRACMLATPRPTSTQA